MTDACTMERYIRNFNTLNKDEQHSLSRAKVCVAGLGGLGGGIVETLARIGVGSLYLVDGDVFDTSNLNRQILCTESLIGTFKVDAAQVRVNEINPLIQVKKHNFFLNAQNSSSVISDVDIVVDCLDSINDRFLLQEAAKKCDIPLVSGAIAGTVGQVTTVFPGDPGFELIYGEKNQTEKKQQGIEQELGNLSFCAMFIAAVQASEAIKVLLKKGDILRNKIFIADLMFNKFEIMALT